LSNEQRNDDGHKAYDGKTKGKLSYDKKSIICIIYKIDEKKEVG